MEIAVVAGLFAEWDVEINTRHLVTVFSSSYSTPNLSGLFIILFIILLITLQLIYQRNFIKVFNLVIFVRCEFRINFEHECSFLSIEFWTKLSLYH